jgi:predicted AlkP superfamily phosphohydrolase/phosphomutase
VVVLGFDGMDWALVRRMLAAGRLPNLRKLANEGLGQPLGTSLPPLSPVAWSDFITGMDAGGHGIFDFTHRDPRTMADFLSTSRLRPSGGGLSFGGWKLPIAGGKVELLRHGEPFWQALRDRGIDTTVLRIPANFPTSGTADRELSGMGTPDLLGTGGGRYSFYSSDTFFKHRSTRMGGRLRPLDYSEGVASSDLEGPPNPLRKDAVELTVPLRIFVDPVDPVALVRVGNEERVLRTGEWSGWVPVVFHMAPTRTLPGQVRLYLRSVRPNVELYASPINVDPLSPAIPISHPDGYARELAEASGRFYTQQMPEEMEAALDGVMTEDEFLSQVAIVQRESENQFRYALSQYRTGFFFYYFGYTDQVAHVLWRSMDPAHPGYNPRTDPKYAGVIPGLYERADRMIGETLREVGRDTTVLIMSDHGFASERRRFGLNAWLEREGYLTLSEKDRPRFPSLKKDVDWSRTRAYGIGYNGLYLNVAERERDGIVPPAEKHRLLHELAAKLQRVIDPATGDRVIRRVFVSAETYKDRGHLGVGPDAVVGYNKTYGCTPLSTLGNLDRNVHQPNLSRWTGNHSMDPATVPGIMFSNRRLPRPVNNLRDLTAVIMAEFGIEGFPSTQRTTE